jgi:hypothetical protein
MSNTSDQIKAEESANLEETKRWNAEREIRRYLAPAKWDELKGALRRECEAISRSASFDLLCSEPDENTFHVDHCKRVSIRVLEFRFHPLIPSISYKFLGYPGMEGILTFVVLGGELLFAVREKQVIALNELIHGLLIRVTRSF